MNVNMGAPGDTWNKLVARQEGHFLQSKEWAQFQLALGRTVLSASGDDWSWLATTREVSGFKYLYAAYGPTVVSNGLKEALSSLTETARMERADFIRIEPVGNIGTNDLSSSTVKAKQIEEIEPAMTSIIDLTIAEEALRHKLSSGHRNAINGAARRGITVRRGHSNEIDKFCRLLGLTAQKSGIRVHEDDYFIKITKVLEPLGAARLYVAETEGEIVAATIIFTGENTWYYAHAASDPAHLKLQAGVPLLWQVILDAKAGGIASFDLWGVVPIDNKGPKSGYSKFKRAFGGTDKNYVGTWDLIVKPARYQIFQLARSASRGLRKLSR
jgi:lipid II:glycine glycyltransferase (peptidoglycan interpeptide bridge formation enzyme)